MGCTRSYSLSLRSTMRKGGDVPFTTTSFASVTFARVRSADPFDVGFYAGYALFGFRGIGPDWLRDDLSFILREPPGPGVGGPPVPSNWQRVDDVVPVIALATIANDGTAFDAGWAIDDCRWRTVPSAFGALRNVELTGQVAARDTDGYILRLAYQATVIGVKTAA
jgi:hypothetical protein